MENIDLILLQSMEQGLEYETVTLQCLNQAHNDIFSNSMNSSTVLLFTL